MVNKQRHIEESLKYLRWSSFVKIVTTNNLHHFRRKALLHIFDKILNMFLIKRS